MYSERAFSSGYLVEREVGGELVEVHVAGERGVLVGEVEIDALQKRLEARHRAQLGGQHALERRLLRRRELQRRAREERSAR